MSHRGKKECFLDLLVVVVFFFLPFFNFIQVGCCPSPFASTATKPSAAQTEEKLTFRRHCMADWTLRHAVLKRF